MLYPNKYGMKKFKRTICHLTLVSGEYLVYHVDGSVSWVSFETIRLPYFLSDLHIFVHFGWAVW